MHRGAIKPEKNLLLKALVAREGPRSLIIALITTGPYKTHQDNRYENYIKGFMGKEIRRCEDYKERNGLTAPTLKGN